jgi:hypothetical protein
VDDFLVPLILAYFKEYGTSYSLIDLHDLIGVSMSKLDHSIDELFDDGFLEYNSDNLMSLSFKGRMLLKDTPMEQYSFRSGMVSSDADEMIEKWETDKPYPIRCFSKNKWRGSEK